MPTNGRASVQIATTQVVFTGTSRGPHDRHAKLKVPAPKA
jgi:hypothetical protein